MTTLSEIKYVDWQMKINTIGEVVEGAEEINQAISIILLTPKGSVPLRPDFGSNIRLYIDYPINEAKAHIIRETVDAITKWETRITVNSVSVEFDISAVLINVEWQLNNSNITGTTEVTYDNTTS